MTLITVRPPYGKPVQAPTRPHAKASSSPWLWMTLACVFLGLSGGIRSWRDWQFASLAARSDHLPFQLSELPRSIGNWISRPDGDGKLEPKVAQFAGSKDYIQRTYLDKKNGEPITALALFGRAEKVCLHSPDVCYPAAGYDLVTGPLDRSFTVPGVGLVNYRWTIYSKSLGGSTIYTETYHTFYFNGKWMADSKNQWKSFRYHPSMFRILLDRPVAGLSDKVHGPSEELLGALVKEISVRVAPTPAGATGGEAPVRDASSADPSKG